MQRSRPLLFHLHHNLHLLFFLNTLPRLPFGPALRSSGVTLVISSVGVERAGEAANAAHYEYLERKLSESTSRWKICVWHMTMGEMQVSYKGDSVGWGAYEICRKHGAFIINGRVGAGAGMIPRHSVTRQPLYIPRSRVTGPRASSYM